MKREIKNNRESRDKIVNRLLDLTKTLRGSEFTETKKDIYRLKYKLENKEDHFGSVSAVDREINRMLDELPKYINSGSMSVVNNYFLRLHRFVDNRGQVGRGELRVSIIKKLFGGKKEVNVMGDIESKMFDQKNILFSMFDEIEKLSQERKNIIDEARRLAPGSSREIWLAHQLRECEKHINSAMVSAGRMIKSISVVSAQADMIKYNELLKLIDVWQGSVSDLENLAADVSTRREAVDGKLDHLTEVVESVNMGHGSSGDYASEFAVFEKARACDDAVKDAEAARIDTGKMPAPEGAAKMPAL